MKRRIFTIDELNEIQDLLNAGMLPSTLAERFKVEGSVERFTRKLDEHRVNTPIETRRFHHQDKEKIGSCLICTNIDFDEKENQQMFKLGDRLVPLRHAIYLANIGPVPAEMMVKDKCGNERCIYPDHLMLASSIAEMKKERVMKNISPEPEIYYLDLNPDVKGLCWLVRNIGHKRGKEVRVWLYIKNKGKFDQSKFRLKEICGYVDCCNPDHMKLVPAYGQRHSHKEDAIIQPEYQTEDEQPTKPTTAKEESAPSEPMSGEPTK